MIESKKKKTNRTTNDPVSDFLTRIRNALMVRKETVLIPHSNFKNQLAELLYREGYIKAVNVINVDKAADKSIEITLKYTENGKPAISGLKRYSKPGLRKYSKAKYAPRVLNGLGISIISTSGGLKTDRAARKESLGGEILCQVW